MGDRLMDENTEDYLEILYWEFDSEKKKFSFSERDLFKAKMRGLIRTIQNVRATNPLIDEMAEALEEMLNFEKVRTWDEVRIRHAHIQKAEQALQKWEAKNAKTTQEKD